MYLLLLLVYYYLLLITYICLYILHTTSYIARGLFIIRYCIIRRLEVQYLVDHMYSQYLSEYIDQSIPTAIGWIEQSLVYIIR